jgi:hypothetical protein
VLGNCWESIVLKVRHEEHGCLRQQGAIRTGPASTVRMVGRGGRGHGTSMPRLLLSV